MGFLTGMATIELCEFLFSVFKKTQFEPLDCYKTTNKFMV